MTVKKHVLNVGCILSDMLQAAAQIVCLLSSVQCLSIQSPSPTQISWKSMCQFRERLALLDSLCYPPKMTNGIKESGGYGNTDWLAVSQVIKMGGQLPP